MNTDAITRPRWATAADGQAADTSPMELSALGEHLALCREEPGHLLALRHAAEQMQGFAAARFITTMVIAVVLFTAVALLL